MGKIIAVVNQKGGVGKTTTTMNLTTYLSELGKSCLLVDLDPQANASSGLGLDISNIESGIYELISGQVAHDHVIQDLHPHKFKIIPASIALAGASVELVNADEREFRLQKALLPLKDQFDYIFIDCPPSLGLLTINGLVAADYVLVPIQAEYFALEGLGQLINTVNLVKEHIKPELEILGAVITMYDKRYRLSENILTELYQHFPKKIFRTVIPRNVRLAEAPSHGKAVHYYDHNSKGAKAYERLAKELISLE